jgi:hypothetical protein
MISVTAGVLPPLAVGNLILRGASPALAEGAPLEDIAPNRFEIFEKVVAVEYFIGSNRRRGHVAPPHLAKCPRVDPRKDRALLG